MQCNFKGVENISGIKKKKKTSEHIQKQHKFVIGSQLKLSTWQTSLTKSMIQTNAKKKPSRL